MAPQADRSSHGQHDRPSLVGREELWQRLSGLCDEIDARGIEALSDRQVEDLGRLYRASTTHLALLRTFGASARDRESLNRLVSRAHAILYGRSPRGRKWAWLATILSIPGSIRQGWPYHLMALSCLLLETDSPVLSAAPGERNEPSQVRISLEAISELKGLAEEEVAEAMVQNTGRLYGDLKV